MRVVLDTNVLLSGLVSENGPPRAFLDAWRRRQFVLVTSHEQIAELRRASRYPQLQARIAHHVIGRIINNLQNADVVSPAAEGPEIDDPFDAYLLRLARDGRAEYLVTGDRQAGLIELKRFAGARIVTPRMFADLL